MSDQTIRRSAAETKKKLLFAGGALILSIMLMSDDQTGWAIIVVLVALIFSFLAFFQSGEAPCPICGEIIQEISSWGAECPHCLHYFNVKEKRLREIDSSSSSSIPIYGIPLPHGECNMPSLCCACGQPAKRTVLVTMETPIGSGTVTTKVARFSIDMPHCDEHDAGASIGSVSRRRAKNDPNASFANEDESFLAIKVKSYAFYLNFMRLNGYRHF